MAKLDLVRPTRDGDQFHYHWAARQCLELLPGSGDLVAVTIEGPSAIESDGTVEEGDEIIDVGLYYGSEILKDARRVRYIQLKHSTRNAHEPWTASGLEKTLRGFARRYASLLKQFPASELTQKIKFEFTTNRPINSKLLETFEDLRNAVTPRHPGLQKTVVANLELSEPQLADFFQLFITDGEEPDLWTQRNLLYHDTNAYLADADYDSPIRLKELVTRKATTEFEKNPAILRYDVLHALRVSELELLPSPCQIVKLNEVLAREQENEILSAST